MDSQIASQQPTEEVVVEDPHLNLSTITDKEFAFRFAIDIIETWCILTVLGLKLLSACSNMGSMNEFKDASTTFMAMACGCRFARWYIDKYAVFKRKQS